MVSQDIIEAVRFEISDYPELKRLNGFKVEFTDAQIMKAAVSSLRKINFHSAYKTELTIATCPDFLLVLGTIDKLLQAKIHEKASNYLDVVESGTKINREGNLQIISQLSSSVTAELIRDLDDYKAQLNFDSAWGY